MKQTQKTRVVSGRRRGGSVLARERKGSGSHSGEWRRALWRERESDVSHLHLGRSVTCPTSTERKHCYGRLALNLYKLKYQFSLSYSIQFDFYHRQSEEHVEN